ncbi:hypothetical protein EMIT0194MI4_10566 [Pseudomonas sp. IT-194MI4]
MLQDKPWQSKRKLTQGMMIGC